MSTETPNKALMFIGVPSDFPVVGEHIQVQQRSIDLSHAPAGGLLLKNLYVSFDPYQRGRMREANTKSYSPPFQLNAPITNASVSSVLKSDTSAFSEGDLVLQPQGRTEEYSRITAEELSQAKKLQNPYNVVPGHFIGALGMPGLTAYGSLYAIGEPKKGETIFISAASGAVGALVGQLAKAEGLKVIGSVGDDEKLRYILDELKFDGGFNYKKEKPLDALQRLAPNGIDIYYENVGGEQLEAAISTMNNHGRIVACGMISQYNTPPEKQYGIKNLMLVVGKRIKIQGFIVGDENIGPVYVKERDERVGKLLKEGTFKAKVHITDGIDNAAEGLLGIFHGHNFGKAALKITNP